ncbi:hypothetical protein K4L44_05950 [Halosquirtibacter laminarini]|uniref:Uncharacterized protein n=1 Tax=Halosquirtibacter laminarini TaxID=3374600 RepID=A0AC61NKS2_9BACT|nr:hypothetical protein K4L44_05950 [Prolixibacteraceae bacterium]
MKSQLVRIKSNLRRGDYSEIAEMANVSLSTVQRTFCTSNRFVSFCNDKVLEAALVVAQRNILRRARAKRMLNSLPSEV